jgi:hypothetical protein
MMRADRGDEGGVAVAQDGVRVVWAVPATVPSQDPVSGAATTDGLVTLTIPDRPCARWGGSSPPPRRCARGRPPAWLARVGAGVWRDDGTRAGMVLELRVVPTPR